ncbi:PAP-associated domain-containing protein [Chloropicon primus]|uniref:Uncharacterized protein n=1 Tax=Chloropicon primus TaxID=1764295 RepID=A0A5B8MNN5_9CHLO|nr:hypothetical protein A3770_07p46510 [Chloropicon primus]UPR01351.1 PAP-associated domain-containing protein [Chloropicon primus]|eukprot:QDZ22133.1 hypothetical protein A3770_07p46510 [Chloropicon primus]
MNEWGDEEKPKRGSLGGIPDGFAATSDDGSRLLALLQGGGSNASSNDDRRGVPPMPMGGGGLPLGHQAPPGSMAASLPQGNPGMQNMQQQHSYFGPQSGLLPPGMNMHLNSRVTQPPGLHHHQLLQQQQNAFTRATHDHQSLFDGGNGAVGMGSRPGGNFGEAMLERGRSGGAPGAGSLGDEAGGGWNPTQFVQDVGSSLLFGGNSTWSMSTQESNQGLGNLWNKPAQRQDNGGGGNQQRQHPPPMGSLMPRQTDQGFSEPILLRRMENAPLGGGFGGQPQGHVQGNQQRTFTQPMSSLGGAGARHLNERRREVDKGQQPPHSSRQRNNSRGGPDFHKRDQDNRSMKMNHRRSNERGQNLEYTKQPKWQPHVLQKQLKDIYIKLLPSREEVAMKKKCFKKIQRILNKTFKGSALHMFGSSANNLGVCKNHDIDLSIEIEVKTDASDPENEDSGSESENEQEEQLNNNNNNNNNNVDNRPTQQQVVKQMARLLRRNRMSKVIPIPKARVPIVKFIEPETGIECDICVNNLLAVENTSLLRKYSEIDPRLKELVILIKHWSKCRGVNGAFKGTLSSYAYVIMVIHLLQTIQPAILPCLQDDHQYIPTVDKEVDGWECRYVGETERFEGFGASNKLTTAELLYQFFYYWGYRHNYKSSVISMRLGDWLTKGEKGWMTRTKGDNHLICIEDPFQISNDLGRVVGRKTIFYLRDEFKRSADILANSRDPIRSGLFAVLSEEEKEKKMKEFADEVEEKRRRRKSVEKDHKDKKQQQGQRTLKS